MWQTIFPVEIKGNYWELSVLGPGAPVALARAHTHTHTEIETLAKRDRGTNKKAEESCFSFPPHTLGDKNEKDRYRHGGGTALTPTSDFKKKKKRPSSLLCICAALLYGCWPFY